MKEFYRKYIDNKLSSEELREFKKTLGSHSDDELYEAMHEEWIDRTNDPISVSDEIMYRVKHKLDDKIIVSHRVIPLYYKIGGWAAAILLPLFIISTFYFYRESSKLVSDEMTVSTSNGEKATITLPDGTLVTLNSNSRLSYIPKKYNKDNRELFFSGEGYFVVSKNKKCPFKINAEGLNVKVLGTTFNLIARKNINNAELFLESGKVLFTSLLKNESLILTPHQKLIMNQQTGKMSIVNGNSKDTGAWRRNEMIFRNASLKDIIAGIENAYNVHINLECKYDSLDLFTGTLVTNDLNGVLVVLENSYKLKTISTNNVVTIRKIE